MSHIGATSSNAISSRILRGESKHVNTADVGECAVARQRRVSLNSKRTLQLLHRAAATEKLRTAAPLWSFKKHANPADRPSPTIAAASREQAIRLYAGPTVRLAGSWEARHDSPGPQAYNEGEKWREKFRNVPSVRIDHAQCERHMVLPTKPGPGDYNIAHHGVGENGSAVKFGDPVPGKKYPPRTPDFPRAEVPCSYAEPEHISCLRSQLTSDRKTSPAVFFGGASRFQEPKQERAKLRVPDRRSALRAIPRSRSKARTKPPALHPAATLLRASSITRSRRGKRRKKRRRRRGGPRIFRRGDYDWLTACVEPKQWEPRLKLHGGGDGEGGRPSTPILDTSRSRSLTERNAPRAVLRQGQRHNKAQYNPQERDLPREKDGYPGPKYDPPPGAFGRTGGRGGTAAPSASVSHLDRFPRGRLFSEEEVREREATPGPEAYDIGLDHRLEGQSLEIMQGSLETLQSWGSLGVGQADGWPFLCGGGRDGAAAAYEFAGGGESRRSGEVGEAGDIRDEVKRMGLSRGLENGRDEEEDEERCDRQHHSTTEFLEGVAKRTMFGRSRTPCFAGASVSPENLLQSTTSETASSHHHRRAGSRCSRLSPASSAAALRGVPCPGCLSVEVATAVNSFVTAAASVSDTNLIRRARMTGASVRFGDMPRQRTAPAFSIGKGQRDVASRLLHTTPGEEIYREARLGRSGKGPASASPRAGDTVTRPRPVAAMVVLPHAPGGGARVPLHSGNDHSGTDAAVADGGVVVVDGALGVQVKSCRPTSPSFTLAGPRRAATLFHERLRYDGKELSAEQRDRAQSREFFNAHVPQTPTKAT